MDKNAKITELEIKIKFSVCTQTLPKNNSFKAQKSSGKLPKIVKKLKELS